MDKPSEDGASQQIGKQGIDPGASRWVTIWANRTSELEKELATTLLQKAPNDPAYNLPWKRLGCVMVGNSCKSLYMQLLIHHLNKVVELGFSDDSLPLGGKCNVLLVDDFLGITQIKILNPEAFNSSQAEAYIHTVAWAKKYPHIAKPKTVNKHWHTVGMKEVGDHGLVYIFDAKLRAQHLASGKNAHEKRVASNKLSSDPPPTKKQRIDVAVMPGVDVNASAMTVLERDAATVLQNMSVASGEPSNAALLDPADAQRRFQAAQIRVTAAECTAQAAGLEIRVAALRAEALRLENLADTIAPK
jgi:hypothetical protein